MAQRKDVVLSDHPLVLIVGGGPSVWDDVEAFWGLEPPPHDVCCVNEAGRYFPCRIKHWMSLHPAYLTQAAKDTKGKPCRPLLHSYRESEDVDFVWRFTDNMKGGSGLFAVRSAIYSLGYKKAVLAGVGITDEPNIFYGGSGKYKQDYILHWKEKSELLLGKVKSMSGNTRYLLGEPTKEWLHGRLS